MSDSTIKRRRRRGSRKRVEEKGSYQQQGAPKVRRPGSRPLPDWHWRTFPVFFSFMLGVVVMGLAAPTPLGIVFFVGLFGLAYGVAHILTRVWVSRRRS